ncbi:hypothetical protein [Streptomyces sp. KL116D]|uniref:hypothetical protein n=1 Tax=Streptomyces sp. KL116D TaxID=3045152 RepID=UPI003557AF67
MPDQDEDGGQQSVAQDPPVGLCSRTRSERPHLLDIGRAPETSQLPLLESGVLEVRAATR